MHEASIAQNVIEIAVRNCLSAGYNLIGSIKLKIGKGSGIEPEALLFAFEIMKLDSPAREATLQLELLKIGGVCNGCRREFQVEDSYALSCPLCGSSSINIKQGYEMEFVEIEVN